MVLDAFRSGARGFVNRSGYDPAVLCHCVQCVGSGQVWANSQQLLYLLEAFACSAMLPASRGLDVLTPREREVAKLVGDGLGNGEVAGRLGLSIHTVKNYLFSVFDKTGVSNRAELTLCLISKNTLAKYPLSVTSSPDDAGSRRQAGTSVRRLAVADKGIG
jgi:DNA-binding NarL/FixJ family response regulator